MEDKVKMAAKLYECRDAAMSLFGDEYQQKIKSYKNVIEEHQKKFNFETLPSVLEICSWESVRDNGSAIMLFMAAAVEIIEPGT